MAWVHFLSSPADSTKVFEAWLREIARQHKTFAVKTVRHDGDRADFGNTTFKNLLKKYDIISEQAGTSTDNAKVERRIGVATTDSLTNMAWCHGPRGWWSYSTACSVTTRNLNPTPTNPGHMSPYEYAYGHKPDYSILVPFGCLAFTVVDNKDMKGQNQL